MTATVAYRTLVLAALGILLASCGGGGSGSSASITTTPVAATVESTFGLQFNTDYMLPANSQPVVTNAGDIIPLTLTAQPTALH